MSSSRPAARTASQTSSVLSVLEQGRIAESGSYDELMARGSSFAELAKRQLV